MVVVVVVGAVGVGGWGDRGRWAGAEYIVSLWFVTLRRGVLVFVIVLGKEALGFLLPCVRG